MQYVGKTETLPRFRVTILTLRILIIRSYPGFSINVIVRWMVDSPPSDLALFEEIQITISVSIAKRKKNADSKAISLLRTCSFDIPGHLACRLSYVSSQVLSLVSICISLLADDFSCIMSVENIYCCFVWYWFVYSIAFF